MNVYYLLPTKETEMGTDNSLIQVMDNKNFQLISAILRGQWLIQKEWANDHMMLILNLLEGKGFPIELQTRVNAGSGGESNDLVGPVSQFENVRIIEINGPIMKYGGMCSYGTLDYMQAIESAYNDDSVDALVLNADCPGGDARSMASLFDLVNMKYKPVVGFVHDLAASGGYYAIAGADYIMASQPTDMIGSIGVFTTLRDYSERMKQMGVATKDIYSRLSTEKNGPSRSIDEGDTGPLEDILDVVAQDFIDHVETGRSGKLDFKAGDPRKGKTYFATEALSIGLIDEIGSFARAIEKAQSLAAERRTNVSSILISNNNSINMFGDKYPLLTALRGVATADVTEESLNAVNAQLSEKGISGIVAVRQDWVTDAEGLQAQISAKNTEIAGLQVNAALVTGLQSQMSEKDTLIASLQGQVTSLTTERDTFKASVETLGKLPAADPAKPLARTEPNVEVKENPFLTETDLQLAELKKGMHMN